MVVPLPATESGKCQHLFVYVGFSNRPFRVKRFQTIHHYSVDVAHGLVGQDPESQFGPFWDIKQRLILQWRSCRSPYQNAPLSQ
jgi:hypothetical protein